MKTEQLNNEELAQHIEKLQAEVEEQYKNRSFDFLKKKDELIGAEKEAKSRGFDTLKQLKQA